VKRIGHHIKKGRRKARLRPGTKRRPPASPSGMDLYLIASAERVALKLECRTLHSALRQSLALFDRVVGGNGGACAYGWAAEDYLHLEEIRRLAN